VNWIRTNNATVLIAPTCLAACLSGIFLLTGCGEAELPADSPAASTGSEKSKTTIPPETDRRTTGSLTVEKTAAKTTAPLPKPKSNLPELPKPPVVNRSEPKSQPVFRPSDNRPKHDAARLAKLGIRKYESKRLILYTDIDPKIARTLPPLLDQAYPAWEKYFGKLPPTRERTPFQVTGYLMKDKTLFEKAGVIPADLPRFLNGRHRGYEFWMHDPPWDYYRRHLLIHEATHCYMYSVRDRRFAVWYMEGMAEFFGTHTIDQAGKVTFGVMPQRYEDFVGFGRIEYVQQDCEAGKPLSIKSVTRLRGADYLRNQAYAWSWALCQFLDSHPRYGKRFRALSRIETPSAFRTAFGNLVAAESPHIHSEWILFANGLVYGYDHAHSAISIRPGKPIAVGDAPQMFALKTDRGWQSSGIWLDQGQAVEVTAAGRFELAQKPKPWVCEPQGISFRYFHGRPLGEVTAVIVPDSEKSLPITTRTLSEIPIGRGKRFTAGIQGTVYFRVNDSFALIGDNQGTVKVTVRRVAAK